MCLSDGLHKLTLVKLLDCTEAEGWSGTEIDNLKAKWLSEVKLTMFNKGKSLFQVLSIVELF